MADLAQIEIERDIADAAARRAAEQGMTLTAYLSLLLRRAFERAPGEESILAYDHIGERRESLIDRDPAEDDETYRRRRDLYDSLFGDRD